MRSYHIFCLSFLLVPALHMNACTADISTATNAPEVFSLAEAEQAEDEPGTEILINEPTVEERADEAGAKTQEAVSDTATLTENASAIELTASRTIRISRNDLSVFEGPGYDYNYTATIWQSGVYTIIQEEQDEEGNLWGKLKSGLGWIDLAQAGSEDAEAAPVTAVYADEQMLAEYTCVEYLAADSEQVVKLAFRPNDTLQNVQLSLLNFDEDGNWVIAEKLYTIPELLPEEALVAGVIFYGDMTAYGFSFTDTDGAARNFAVHISGRNGELLMDEF